MLISPGSLYFAVGVVYTSACSLLLTFSGFGVEDEHPIIKIIKKIGAFFRFMMILNDFVRC